MYKATPTQLWVDFPAETLQAREEWHDIFKMIKEKTYNQEYLTQEDYHSEAEKRLKSFPGKQKLTGSSILYQPSKKCKRERKMERKKHN